MLIIESSVVCNVPIIVTMNVDTTLYTGAATQIESIALHINDYIQQHENFKKMLSIQNALSGQSVPGILAPARKFIHEGKLMKVSVFTTQFCPFQLGC